MIDIDRKTLNLVLFILGVILLVLGAALREEGLVPIGLILAAVNYYNWQEQRALSENNDQH